MNFNKKKITIIAGAVFLSVILLLAFSLFFGRKSQTSISPIGNSDINNVKKTEPKLLKYQDTAGFSFDYLENLIIEDSSENDPEAYSLLEITRNDLAGKMEIKIIDSNFASVGAWLKSKEATSAGTSREIMVSEMTGKQVQLENPPRLISLVISDGVEYFFQSPLDENGQWNKIHNAIISSFKIQPPETETQGNSGETVDVGFEEEEIIE